MARARLDARRDFSPVPVRRHFSAVSESVSDVLVVLNGPLDGRAVGAGSRNVHRLAIAGERLRELAELGEWALFGRLVAGHERRPTQILGGLAQLADDRAELRAR